MELLELLYVFQFSFCFFFFWSNVFLKAWNILQVQQIYWKTVGSSFTANLQDGLRPSETAVEDMFIRKFITGTFPGLLVSEVIIKRQFNHIRIAFLMKRMINPQKVYFLIGYSEELLANWLQCPITLEIQSVAKPEDTVYKYI